MDERKTNPSAKSTPQQPVRSDAALLAAFARTSGDLGDTPSAAPERTENSVMEGLPPAKAERIAAMRRELAELQKQLIEAQQRVATELQGRAEDAERFEALEARVQAQETKAKEEATRTPELVAEVASLRSQLASVGATVEELRRDVVARDAQLEEARRQHRDVTDQLASHTASLTETKTLVETRDAELAALRSERDVHEADAAAARAKVRDVATQLARFGQDLMEGAGAAQTVPSADPDPAAVSRGTERPKPPPVPTSRAQAKTETNEIQPILEVTEESRSGWRTALVLIGGVVLGCVATIAVVASQSSSATPAGERQDLGGSSPASRGAEKVSESTSPPAMRAEPVAVTSPSPPTPIADPDMKARSNDGSDVPPTRPPEIATDGVIVLPQEAADHRIFVDGRVVSVKNSRAVVPCGTHEIRIGGHGTVRTLDVACGGETPVPAEQSVR